MTSDGILSSILYVLERQDERLQWQEASIRELTSQLNEKSNSNTGTTAVLAEGPQLRMQCLEDNMRQMQSRMQEIISKEVALEDEVKHMKSCMQADPARAQAFEAAHRDAGMLGFVSAGTLVATATNDSDTSATEDRQEDIDSVSQQNYVFESSVYDATFFVFTQPIGMGASLFIMIGFLTNLAMQLAMIAILETQFTVQPLPGNALDRLDAWRKSEGHWARNVDAMSGASLAARVCGMDEALSTSATQVSIFEDAETFMGIVVFEWIHLGPLLCNIAIMLWTFTCANELRKSVEFMEAVIHIPRVKGRSKMVACNGALCLQGLNLGRVLIGFGVVACRATIAIVLCIFGSIWLAHTTSVQDLLLNASALGFVLEIDETVFAVLAPTHILGLINSLRSISLPLSMSFPFVLPCMLGLVVFSSVLVINRSSLNYTYSRLSLASDILCSDSTNLDFVVGVSELGWLYYAAVVPFDPENTITPVAARRMDVIDMIVDKDPEASNYYTSVGDEPYFANAGYVEAFASMPTAEMAALKQHCQDDTGVALGRTLWTATANQSFETVDSCAQLKTYCTDPWDDIIARNVRYMCPITCGCADPLSGIWHLAQEISGCPWTSCQSLLRAALMDEVDSTSSTYGCQDRSLSELHKGTGWSHMLLQLIETMRVGATSINFSQIRVLQSKGCDGLRDFSYKDRHTVCARENIFATGFANPFFGAGVMCPESCGCYYDYGGEDPDDHYPYIPGEEALCPMASCGARYYESKSAQQATVSNDS